jgi:hypothetical protein
MKYPKQRMKIKELVEMGYSKVELMKIHNNRGIQRDYRISRKMSDAPNSPIVFDTEQLAKYERAQSIGG